MENRNKVWTVGKQQDVFTKCPYLHSSKPYFTYTRKNDLRSSKPYFIYTWKKMEFRDVVLIFAGWSTCDFDRNETNPKSMSDKKKR